MCSTLLDSSGIAGIYHARCLGKSGLCRSQIRGLRMSHRLFLECTRGPTPGTLIDQKGFHILCFARTNILQTTTNSLRALLTRNMDFLWSCWKPYHPIIMEDLRYFRSRMTVLFCTVPGLLSSSPTTTAVLSRSLPEFLLLLLLLLSRT